MKRPVSDFPIMKNPCATCPFRESKKGVWQNIELANTVIERNLFNSQQICHHPRIKDDKETHRCRGYFNYAEVIYQRLGFDTKALLKNSYES